MNEIKNMNGLEKQTNTGIIHTNKTKQKQTNIGCVVRYSLDNTTWTILGSSTTGLNWFNANRIFGFESFSFPGATPGE